MNIALVTGSFLPQVGGLEWKVHYLGNEYIKRGHSVTVFANRTYVSMKPISPEVDYDYDLIRCAQPLKGIGRFGIDRFFFRRAILKSHRNYPFDVLHCHGAVVAARYGLDVKEKINIPVVVTTTGGDVQMIPEINYGNRLDPRLDRIFKDNLQKVDIVGSISSSIKADLECLIPAEKIVNIPNGVDWDRFQVGPSKLLRERLEISDDKILILSVGRNHIVKGYRFGIEAFAKITDKHENCCYAIVGKDTTKLSELIEKFGMTGRIKLVEQVSMSEMPQIYHSSDVFFNPSQLEGFAQVNAQALACGLPCVITDAPGNRDAGDHGGALIARSEDVESMAEKLEDILSDAGLRKDLAAKAHLAGRKYAWSRIAEQYLDVFEELISQKEK